MLTTDQTTQLRKLLKQFGLLGPETDRLLTYPNHQVNRIILTFSLLDISTPDREIYKRATEHKFFLYLYALKRIFEVAGRPLPPVELLFVDELQKHNLHSIEIQAAGDAAPLLDGLIEQRLADWGKYIVKLPDLVSLRQEGKDRTRKLTFTIADEEGTQETITQTVRLSSWRDYLTGDIKETIQALKDKLYQIAAQSNAADILSDDLKLFGPEAPLSALKQQIVQALREATDSLDLKDEELDAICEKATYSAAHYLKKAGKLHTSLSKNDLVQLQKQKREIIQAFPDQGVTHFIESLLYIIEETLVLNYILAEQPRGQNIARDTGIHMLYGSGIVEIPSCHPMFVYSKLCTASDLNRSILTFSSFNQFYQGLTAAKLALLDKQTAAANEPAYNKTSDNSSQSSHSSGGKEVLTLHPKDLTRNRSGSQPQPIPSPAASEPDDDARFADFIVQASLEEAKKLFMVNPEMARYLVIRGLKTAADLETRSHSSDEEDVAPGKKRRGTHSNGSTPSGSPTEGSLIKDAAQSGAATLTPVFTLRPTAKSPSRTPSPEASPSQSPTPASPKSGRRQGNH